MAVPIVVCACGARLRAPGARPGRVGRCPGCGASLKIGEDEPPATAEPQAPARARPAPRREGAPRAPKVGRRKPEGFWASHAYPFRDANGTAYLAFLPAAWLAASVGPMLLASSIVADDQLSGLARVAFVPSLLGIPPALAYTLTYLNRAFATTVAGDDLPPRWPDLDVWEQLRALGVWAAALAAGAVAGGLPAWLFWTWTPSPGPLDRAAAALLLAFGAVYAQMALAAGLLFDDVLAMNPRTVLKAIRAMGPGLFRPVAYAAGSSAAVGGLLALAVHSTRPLVSLPAWLGTWGLALYLALVSTRILGVECRRRARALGWFREVRATGPGP